MKIILFAPANSIHSERWFDFFRKRHRIVWASLHHVTNLTDNNKKPYLLPGKTIFLLYSALKLLIKARKEKSEIIHILSVARYGLISIPLLLFTNIKLIISPWGSDLVEGSKSFVSRIYLRYLIRRAIFIHLDAKHIAEICEYLEEGSSVKCKHIMYGVETDVFRPDDTVNQQDNTFKVLSIRNHEKIYNVDLIISAFEELSKKNDNMVLRILSSGSETEFLKKMVKEKNLSEKINFIGWLTEEEMVKTINHHDLIISASSRDGGLASSIGEAMSCGKPVLVSSGQEDDNVLWIDHGKNGFLFENESLQDLVQTFNECILDKEKLKEVGIKARSTILDKYDRNKEMEKMELLYEESQRAGQ